MYLLGPLPDDFRAHLPALRRGHERRSLAFFEEAELVLHRSDGFRRVKLSGESEDGPAGDVIARHERAQRLRLHPEDHRLAAGHLPAERVTRVEELVDERVHAVLGLIAV